MLNSFIIIAYNPLTQTYETEYLLYISVVFVLEAIPLNDQIAFDLEKLKILQSLIGWPDIGHGHAAHPRANGINHLI